MQRPGHTGRKALATKKGRASSTPNDCRPTAAWVPYQSNLNCVLCLYLYEPWNKSWMGATVAATRSQSLTVILSQIDMMGIIGMIQVLAARAHPIQEVYQATSNWTMPELRAGETQLEQSDREIASWRLNHAGHWQEQTEPPLSIFYLKTKVGGKSADMKPVRLRLILVSAADVRLWHWDIGSQIKRCPPSLCQVFISLMHGESVRVWRYQPSYQ